jgi:hypothetical protein
VWSHGVGASEADALEGALSTRVVLVPLAISAGLTVQKWDVQLSGGAPPHMGKVSSQSPTVALVCLRRSGQVRCL